MPRVTQLANGQPKTGPTSSDFWTRGVSPVQCGLWLGRDSHALLLLSQGKEKFLGILNKYMEIHGTVYYESQRPPEVPAFVKNHGLLPQPEFQQLLRKAKVSSPRHAPHLSLAVIDTEEVTPTCLPSSLGPLPCVDWPKFALLS